MNKFFTLALASCAYVMPFSGQAFAADHIVHVASDYEDMQMKFVPFEIKVKPGDTVTWINDVAETHSIITYPDGYPEGAKGFTSPTLEKAGEKWSHIFNNEGTYEYHCVPHIMMGMRGSVVVGKASDKTKSHKPTAKESKAYRDLLLQYFDEDSIKQMPSYLTDRLKETK